MMKAIFRRLPLPVILIGILFTLCLSVQSNASANGKARQIYLKRHFSKSRSITRISSPLAVETTSVGSNVNASNRAGAQSETFITVDPNNPARVLAGSNDIAGVTMRAYYSTNTGNSFSGSAPGRAIGGYTFGFCSDPGLAFDLNGNAFYSYLVIANDQVHDGVVVAKSTTGGQNWNTPIAIAVHTTAADTTVFEDKSLMTIDTNSTSPYKDNIYVIWDRGDAVAAHMLFSRSTNGGASYTSPIQIDDNASSSGGVIYGDPAVGPNGEVYAVWNDYGFSAGNDRIVFDKSTDGGVTWGTDIFITSTLKLDIFDNNAGYFIPAEPDRGIAASPVIDTDRSNGPHRGWIYASWCDSSTSYNDTDIYFSRSTDGGVTWSSPKRVNDDTTVNSQFFQWMSVDPTDGSIHLSWYDCRDDVNNQKTNVYYTRSTDGGNTFDPNLKITTVASDESASNTNADTGNNYGDYEGIVASRGIVHPVWTDTRNGSATNGTEEVYTARIIQASPPLIPVAGFYGSPTVGIGPLTVNFVDTSSNSPSAWSWNFGDSSTGNTQNPSHTYLTVSSTSFYTVRFIASNSFGTTTSTLTNYITVLPPALPQAGFYGTPTVGIGPLQVNFVDTSVNFPTGWTWDFGDFSSSTSQNPNHLYGIVSTPTVYSVRLIVTNSFGTTTSTIINYIVVNPPPPSAGFYGSPTSGIGSFLVNFTDTSLFNPTSWNWNFGDGASTTIQNPQHFYISISTPTSYTVSLIISNAYGNSTLVRINYISQTPPPPDANFIANPTTGTSPLQVNFSDSSFGNPTAWSWDFGDGGTSTTQNPLHIYSTNTVATYSVQLIAGNPYGSSTALFGNYIAVIPPPPQAGFYGTPTSDMGPLLVNFVDTSINLPTSWAWSFGDGSTDNIQNPSHLYSPVTAPTSYTVQLIASNAFGSSTTSYANYITVAVNTVVPPSITALPNLKLYIGQSLSTAFDLADFNTSGVATSYSIPNDFLGLSNLTGSIVNQNGYGSATAGNNTYQLDNLGGSVATTNRVKYSTYKITKVPPVVLRAGSSVSLNMKSYTTDSTGANTIPPSFGNISSLIVSDYSQITASWSNNSVLTITALGSGVSIPQSVDVIAAPISSGYGVDIDKERIMIYPSLSTTGFEFSSASNTTLFSYQLPAGISKLATISQVSTVKDSAGISSNGGILKITYGNLTSGIKITPKFSTWLPNNAGSYYTLRVRFFGDSTISNYQQGFFNGNPGQSPTDITGYFLYSMPTVWTTIDIPLSSYTPVSSANVMYPQLVLKANGKTGTVYIDEMEIFLGTPTLIGSPRYPTADKYVGGYWNDASATGKWSIQTLSGSVNYNVSSGALLINTVGTSSTQSGVKFTASPSSGTIYTATVKAGRQTGMHMNTKLVSGSANISQTQVQLNMLGAKTSGSFSLTGDIAAVAEIGRISDRTLRLEFPSAAANYQIQFIVKNSGNSSIQIDNTLADIDNDDPNYGDVTLFP